MRFINFTTVVLTLSVVMGVSIAYAQSFPTSLNNFVTGDLIEADDWNAIEQTLGEESSSISTSTNYRLTNAASVDPGHLHTSSGISGTLSVGVGGTGNTAYTAGSVVFSNGTILTQDNTNFFWDDSNNRLGIGTASPNAPLTIIANSAGTTTRLQENSGGEFMDLVVPSSGDLDFITDDGFFRLKIPDDDSSTSNGNIYTGGVCGISISGTIDANTCIDLDTDAYDFIAGDVEFLGITETISQDTFVINENSNDIDFRWESDGDDHAVFFEGSSGNVGIGSSTPSRLLTVEGTGYFGGNLTATGSITTGTKNLTNYADFYNGTFVEQFDATTTSNGSAVTVHLGDSAGNGNLTMRFNAGDVTLTTPTSTTLTAGSDTSPTENFVYIPFDTQALTVSTSNWPVTEHIKVAYFFVPSATFVQSNGIYVNQNWNDEAQDDNSQGHLTHVTERQRRMQARHFSGVDSNGTDGYLTPTASNVEFKSTSGTVYQLHDHVFPAVDTSVSSIVLVKNWSGESYRSITNLFDITEDSASSTIADNKYFNLVFWGVVNKTGAFHPMMVNLPGGSYNTQSTAENDTSGFDDLTIPDEFKNESATGFLIARLTIQMGTTWDVISTVDLRGLTPQSATGGTASGELVNFPDNTFTVFDNTDVTKIGAFDIGTNVTTGNTRTISWPDSNLDLDAIPYANLSITGSVLEADLSLNAPTNDFLLVASSSATGGFEWSATSSANLGLTIHITNALGGTNLTLSGNTLNVDDAFLVNDANDETSGTLTVGGIDLGTTGNRIDLDTDNDTSIRSTADDFFVIEQAGIDNTIWSTTDVRFNDTTLDIDFSIDGNNVTDLFFVDGTTDRIGIATTSPGALLTVGSSTLDKIAAGEAYHSLFVSGEGEFNGQLWADAGATIATFLDIPSSADPTVATEGYTEIDTASGTVRFHDGSEERVIYPYDQKTITNIASTSIINSLSFDSATVTLKIGRYRNPVTFEYLDCGARTGAVTVNIGDGTSSSSLRVTDGSDTLTLSSNNTFIAGEDILLSIGSTASGDYVDCHWDIKLTP